MLNSHPEVYQWKLAKTAALAVGTAAVIWELSNWIVAGDLLNLVILAAGAAGLAIAIFLLKDWRYGVYCFLGWLVFEDLIRKFAGNSVPMFFAKDAIAALTYGAMLLAYRRRQLPTFKAPWFLWIGIFAAVGFVQILNPNSPSVLYGILGFKTYFFYVPLIFAGYALLRSEKDLYKILMLNTWIALIVAGLGVAQSVLGLNFLNPADLTPDLQNLGHDTHVSPLSHLTVERSTSVYVSDGRFAEALILFFILGVGTAGYLLMRGKGGRKIVFPGVGVVVLATIMGGVRHAFVSIIGSAIILVAAFFWGARGRLDQFSRIRKAIRWAVVFGCVGVLLMTLLAPDAINARWALYSETLNPQSSASELGNRGWQYPIDAMESVFTQPNWLLGNGIGTVSLGTQYVSRLVGTPPLRIGSESGYGSLILEFGIIGPILWALWVGTLLSFAWKAVRKLRRTRLFPVGFAFFWYAVYILGLGFFYSLPVYQNYLSNAYLWLTLGMLFRLPALLAPPKTAAPFTPAYAAGRP